MKLGVLPPSGGSLTSLDKTGQLSRFVDHYLKAYAEAFDEVFYFSYRNEDFDLPEGVRLVPPGNANSKLYGLLLPWVHRRELRQCHVLRVMQAPGAHPAILTRWLHGLPYVTTFGYHYSEFLQVDGASSRRVKVMRLREKLACRYADAVIQPSPAVRDRIIQLAGPGRTVTIPNAVDVDQFAPPESPPAHPGPIFVGRLKPQKNLPLLLRAMGGLDDLVGPDAPRLRLIGRGPQKEELLQQAVAAGIDIAHSDSIPNEDLPDEFGRAGIFVLPSHMEGMPKVLLEAMACGCACLGNNSPGIADFIEDGETGLLFDGTEDHCRAQLQRLLTDGDLRARLGANARRYIVDHYNLEEQIEREIKLLKSVGERGKRRLGIPREAPEFE